MFRSRWFQILVIGATLFLIAEQAMRWTGNQRLAPAVIVLGATVIPAAAMVYFYGLQRAVGEGTSRRLSLPLLATCLFVGGAFGISVAAIIEFETIGVHTVSGYCWVALIEESAKLIVPVIVFVRWRHRSEVDGILLGIASGMGLAVFEAMGYGMTALFNSNGNMALMEQAILARGLLAPIGHAAWTAMICAGIWHERERTGKMFTWNMLGIFVVVVTLHVLWNLISDLDQMYLIVIGYVLIAGIDVGVLVRRLKLAKGRLLAATPAR